MGTQNGSISGGQLTYLPQVQYKSNQPVLLSLTACLFPLFHWQFLLSSPNVIILQIQPLVFLALVLQIGWSPSRRGMMQHTNRPKFSSQFYSIFIFEYPSYLNSTNVKSILAPKAALPRLAKASDWRGLVKISSWTTVNKTSLKKSGVYYQVYIWIYFHFYIKSVCIIYTI